MKRPNFLFIGVPAQVWNCVNGQLVKKPFYGILSLIKEPDFLNTDTRSLVMRSLREYESLFHNARRNGFFTMLAERPRFVFIREKVNTECRPASGRCPGQRSPSILGPIQFRSNGDQPRRYAAGECPYLKRARIREAHTEVPESLRRAMDHE